MNTTLSNNMYCEEIHNLDSKLKTLIENFKSNTESRIIENLVSRLNISYTSFESRLQKITKKNVSYMNNNLINLSHGGSISNAIWNLDKGQDFSWIGFNNNNDYCTVVCDGHGDDDVITWIYSQSDKFWIEICSSPIPTQSIEECLKSSGVDTTESGTTITIVVASDTQASIYWLGDSSCQVYINGFKKYEIDLHLPSNLSEMERKLSEGGRFEPEMMLQVMTPGINPKMTKSLQYRCIHGRYAKLQMTRSLGDGHITGNNYSMLTVNYKSTDDVKIISGSDGIFDVTHENESLQEFYTAEDLVRYAGQKWLSDWDFVHWENHNCLKCRNKKCGEVISTVQPGIAPDDISGAIIWLPPQ